MSFTPPFRRRAFSHLAALAGLAGLTIFPPARAADPDLPASWRRADVLVDGLSDDWSGRLVPLGETPIVVAVQNDGDFLYLCLRTADESAKRVILGSGLSIYLDASGKHDRAFGVRYPVGRAASEPGRDGDRERSERRPPPEATGAGDMKTLRSLELAAAGSELSILHEEKGNRGVMKLPEALPLKAALGEEDGALVLELRVPLAFSLASPHAIETAPGRTIALGLETKEPKEDRGSGFRFGGGGGPGGAGGPGGRRGHGGAPPDAGPSGPRANLGKAIKVWATVTLANPPADAAAPKAPSPGPPGLTAAPAPAQEEAPKSASR